jgi:uncharacterized membrane protein YfcA
MVARRMDLVLFAVWCFVVALAGGLVGLVLGNIRLPATLLLAPTAAAAGGANILISGVAAAAAAIAHVRAGRVNWRLFAWMAPPSVAGAVLGGSAAGVIGEGLLLGVIAAVLLSSGVDLLRWRPRAPSPGEAPPADRFDHRAAVVSGAAIGVLGGLVGLILGALRMPALIRYVGEPPHRAVGTNLLVGVCVGVAGALAHLATSEIDWQLVAVGAAASVPGALLGSRLTGLLSETQLVRAVAVVLFVTAAACGVQAVG